MRLNRIMASLLLLLALTVSTFSLVGCENGGGGQGTVQLDENGEPVKAP